MSRSSGLPIFAPRIEETMLSRTHLLTQPGTLALTRSALLGQLFLAVILPSVPGYRPHGSTAPSPVVSSVSPDHAPNRGASGVVITGANFAGATQVLFGPNAVSFTVDSDTQISASLGAVSTTGWVDVSVTTADGTGTLVHAFDYFQPPTRFDGCFALDWSGSPTLGQSYTITAYPFISLPTTLLVRWSPSGIGNHSVSYFPMSYYGFCRPLFRRTSLVALVGSPPSYTFAIPNDASLIGVRLQTQAIFWCCPMFQPVPWRSDTLDAVIGE